MAVAKNQDNYYRETESVNQVSTEIHEAEYSKLADLDISETRQVGELEYLDIYDGETRNESALNVRVIAGDEPYPLSVTYHKLADSAPDTEAIEQVEKIVGEIDIDRLLE
jgi:hypothetical protein